MDDFLAELDNSSSVLALNNVNRDETPPLSTFFGGETIPLTNQINSTSDDEILLLPPTTNLSIEEDSLLVPQNAPGALNLGQDGDEVSRKSSKLGREPVTGETDDANVGEADTLTGNNTERVEIETRSWWNDVAGNNRRQAYNVGNLDGTKSYEESVSGYDRKDFYKFKVKEKTDVNLELDGLTGNADLYLLNNKGKVIEKSKRAGRKAEDIERTLNPGTYYVRVESRNNGVYANYDLSLDAASSSKSLEKYEFTYYYGGSQGERFQDYYSGYVYAPKGTYKTRSYYDFKSKNNEAGANGKYYISSSSTADAKAKDGEVYLKSYYDVETSKSYTPYYASGSFASGTSGLGSEEDFIGARFDSEEDVAALSSKAFFGADKYVADIVAEAKISNSGDYQINALLSGLKWGADKVTYSFYDDTNRGQYYSPERGVREVSEKVKQNVRHILENIFEPIMNVNFVEVSDTSSSYGLIRVMKSETDDNAYAYAHYPFAGDSNSGNGSDVAGDVYLRISNDGSGGTSDFQGGPGTHGYLSLIHELGHAVGLKHPRNYNKGEDSQHILEKSEDNTRNTVMSYSFDFKARELMPYDIKALRYIYGSESPKGSITVSSPNGGNTLEPGNSYTITWNDNISENVKLELYKGSSFNRTISSSTSSDGSYSWTVPTSINDGSDYKVKITSTSDSSTYDYSNSNFTIKADDPDDFITVTSPNGGNNLEKGKSYNLTWNDNLSENVRIYLFEGDELDRMITNSTPSDGTYTWTVPTSLATGSNYEIAIQSVTDNDVFDYSNSNFTIKPDDSITVNSPNGGNTLEPGNSYTITWNDNISENVKLELYKGSSFNRTISSSTSSDGSYSWAVPTSITDGSNYKVKITSASDSSTYDYSNSNFTIKADDPDDFITVTSPNGGNTLEKGKSHNLTWNDNLSENVRIYLFEGDELDRMITNSTPSDGSYTWTVPTSLATGSNYQIAIQSVTDNEVFDYSNSNFTIKPDDSITVNSPNGGNTLEPGNSYTITWNDNISGNVKLELYKGGSFNRTISSSTSSDGSYSWAVPTSITDGSNYKVKITSASDSSTYDYSNSNFTIKADDPDDFITVTSPNGGNTLEKGKSHNLTWNDNLSENVRIYLFEGDELDRMITNSTPSDGSYTWTVPTSLATGSNYEIAIQSVTDNDVFDYSNSNFTIKQNDSVTDKYYFTYSYDDVSDYYDGFFYDKPGAYGIDDILYTSDGEYEIWDIESSAGSNNDSNDVYVYSYYDGNYTGSAYDPWLWDFGEPAGENGLGSESDYIVGSFGFEAFDPYQEADG